MTKKQMIEELKRRFMEILEIWKFEIGETMKNKWSADRVKARNNEYSNRVLGFLRASNVILDANDYETWEMIYRSYFERISKGIEDYSMHMQ